MKGHTQSQTSISLTPNLLVAPVLNSGGTRFVCFSQETSYLEYYNKTLVHHGGTTALVLMNVHYASVFVRAGTVCAARGYISGQQQVDRRLET